jgi:replicative DNA helicase
MVLELAQIDSTAVRRNVTAEVIEKVKEALRILWNSGVVLFDAVGADVALITATIRRFRTENANARLVVVDNLSGISTKGGRRDSMHEFYGSIVRQLHAAALHSNLPLWLLAHTKRPEGGKRGGRPSLTDFALSSVLERFAHAAMILVKREDPLLGEASLVSEFGGTADPTSTHELHVMKNRDNREFVADLRFIGPQMRFEDPNGRTVRPYELPAAESARVGEYRRRHRELGL